MINWDVWVSLGNGGYCTHIIITHDGRGTAYLPEDDFARRRARYDNAFLTRHGHGGDLLVKWNDGFMVPLLAAVDVQNRLAILRGEDVGLGDGKGSGAGGAFLEGLESGDVRAVGEVQDGGVGGDGGVGVR